MNATFAARARKQSAAPMMATVFLKVEVARLRRNMRNTATEKNPKTAAIVRFSQYVCTDARGWKNDSRKTKSEEFGYGDDEFAPWTLGATM